MAIEVAGGPLYKDLRAINRPQILRRAETDLTRDHIQTMPLRAPELGSGVSVLVAPRRHPTGRNLEAWHAIPGDPRFAVMPSLSRIKPGRVEITPSPSSSPHV